MRVLLPILAVLLFTTCARAVIVNLADGTQIEGKIQKTADGWNVTQSDGTVVSVSADKVVSIEASASTAPVSVADDRLESLRRVANQSQDIQDMITRYQKFIAQTGDPGVAAQAQEDLAIWQDRQDRGMVKLGDQWITPQERERRRAAADTEAAPAKDLIANYRYAEAAKILQQALTDDAQSAPALYLQGVLLYKQGDVAKSRKSFESMLKLIPDHAPTLNNLAVITWRQKSFVIAMNYYDQAMMSAPVSKEILDNVAEAINGVPPESQTAPVVLQAVRLFAEQDATLQKLAAAQGMYRWGATWVTAKQLEELKADEARVKQELAALQAQFDAIQQKLSQIDTSIAQNQIELDRLAAQSVYVDRNGNTVQMPLPDQYYALKRDNDSLTAQKQPLQQQQAALQGKAKQAQSEIPVPKFTGVQQIIGVDGTPVHDPSDTGATTTAPSPAN
jgi:tetratricopeptide (TPR) repeat protein